MDEFEDIWSADRNFPVLRYAEVLLSYAEAKIEQNQIDASVYDAIDQVRERVPMPKVDRAKYNSQATLRELVRRERRVEFAYEGLRRMDIIRWGIAKDVLNQPVLRPMGELLTTMNLEGDFNVKLTAPELEVLPIPQSAIDANPNLKQNPGY